MPLVGHLHEPRHAESGRAVQTLDRLRRVAAVAHARRIELPGHVRQQHVLEPERAPGTAPHRADEASEALDPPAREVGEGRPLLRLAQARRAEAGGLLRGVHLVRRRQQGEQVGRMRVDVGARPRARVASVEHRGNRQRGAVVHRRRAAVPGGAAGEPGERRVALSVETAARAHQRRERQLVEHDHDDRPRARCVGPQRLGVLAREPLGRVRRRGLDQSNAQSNRGGHDRRSGNRADKVPVHESPA